MFTWALDLVIILRTFARGVISSVQWLRSSGFCDRQHLSKASLIAYIMCPLRLVRLCGNKVSLSHGSHISRGVILPHLPCEIFRAILSHFLIGSPSTLDYLHQFSVGFSHF